MKSRGKSVCCRHFIIIIIAYINLSGCLKNFPVINDDYNSSQYTGKGIRKPGANTDEREPGIMLNFVAKVNEIFFWWV